jgi:IS1 family transposase
MDSIFGKVLVFVCGRRTIKTGKVLWQQLEHLPTMGYGRNLLKTYENFIPYTKHCAGKIFTTLIKSILPIQALSSQAPS